MHNLNPRERIMAALIYFLMKKLKLNFVQLDFPYEGTSGMTIDIQENKVVVRTLEN